MSRPNFKFDWRWIILSVVIIGLVIYAVYEAFFSARMIWKSDAVKPDLGESFFSRLDGTVAANESAQIPLLVAAMIDNNKDARPPAGLNSARVVYEAPAEGNITRYLALFTVGDSVDKVGPIRSARPYFLDWVAEYGRPLYLHSGGSPEALRLLKTGDYFDVNEFYWGSYFWRDQSRPAPHNLYTKSELWQKIAASDPRAATPASYAGWRFSVEVAGGEPVAAIFINYAPGYGVSWKYDAITGRYVYWINAAAALDDQGKNITADDVVVQYVAARVLDEEGRLEIGTTGTGEARLFREGRMTRGRWQKNSAAERTLFLDEQGQELSLLPGKIWIQIVPVGTTVEISN